MGDKDAGMPSGRGAGRTGARKVCAADHVCIYDVLLHVALVSLPPSSKLRRPLVAPIHGVQPRFDTVQF